MKYFKNEKTGQVFAYEADGSQDEFISEELIQMSLKEVELHLNPKLSKDQDIQLIKLEIQKYMDGKAKEYGYDDIKSAVSYAEEPSVLKFQIEGLAFRAWRSQVWSKCFQLLSEFESGKRKTITVKQIIAELPIITI